MPVEYLGSQDVEQLKAAARLFDCWILVRRTHSKNLKLYAIVPRQDPWTYKRVIELRPDEQPHDKNRFDAQHFLNCTIGVPAILDPCQAQLLSSDEAIDVFWPDGVRVTPAADRTEIENLCRRIFQGA